MLVPWWEIRDPVLLRISVVAASGDPPPATLTHTRGAAAARGVLGGVPGATSRGPCEGPGNLSKLKSAFLELRTCVASPPF